MLRSLQLSCRINDCLQTSNGRTVITNCLHTQPVTTVRLHEHSNLIVSGSDDTNVQIWDLARLLYFSAPADQNIRDSLRAFTQHRTAIADVCFNRGQLFSVVAISASKDGICHIWDPTTLELSRTILLNTVPRCLVLDPADRVLYIGSEDGSISSVDFLRTFIPLSRGKTNQAIGSTVQEQTSSFAQLENASAVHCLTISFDSTVLLSGHEDGKVHAWDAGKGKYKQLIVDLSQPVTNLLMLHPEGLDRIPSSCITVPTVIKPKPAETFSSGTHNAAGTSGIPSSYTIHVQLTGAREPSMPSAEYETRLRNPGFFTPGPFPRSLIDEGLAEFSKDTIQAPELPSKPVASAPTEVISPIDVEDEVSAQGRIRWLSRELASKSSELEITNQALARYDARWKVKRAEYLEREEAIRRQLLTGDVDVTVQSKDRDALVAKVEREVEDLKSEIFGEE